MTALSALSGGAATIIAAPFIALSALTAPGTDHGCPTANPTARQPAPLTSAARTIPADYLKLYQQAGHAAGIDWTILAAIGSVESDHGRGHDPGIHSGHNQAGAMGPMQFLPATWRDSGVDGNHDGHRNVYDPADAIPAAANELRKHGAPADIKTALFAYNHSMDYVRLILRRASQYATRDPAPPDPLLAQARCATNGTAPSHSSPTQAGNTTKKILSFAQAQIGKPYVWGATGPRSYDCSGLTQRAYQAAGITIPRTTYKQWHAGTHVARGQEQPGDLVFFDSGPNSSADHPGHVGIVVSRGRMIVAPHTGTTVQYQSYRHRTDLVGFVRIVRKFSHPDDTSDRS
jgi:cell wall-associated NlpC family hydrolase